MLSFFPAVLVDSHTDLILHDVAITARQGTAIMTNEGNKLHLHRVTIRADLLAVVASSGTTLSMRDCHVIESMWGISVGKADRALQRELLSANHFCSSDEKIPDMYPEQTGQQINPWRVGWSSI